jgi:hypothetical protein
MLNQSTLDKLYALRLTGMAEAYQQQLNGFETRGLSFEERFGMLVDNHWTWRENQSLVRRLVLKTSTIAIRGRWILRRCAV